MDMFQDIVEYVQVPCNLFREKVDFFGVLQEIVWDVAGNCWGCFSTMKIVPGECRLLGVFQGIFDVPVHRYCWGCSSTMKIVGGGPADGWRCSRELLEMFQWNIDCWICSSGVYIVRGVPENCWGCSSIFMRMCHDVPDDEYGRFHEIIGIFQEIMADSR